MMRYQTMLVVGLGAILSTVGCSHKVPIATAHPVNVPVQSSVVKSTPAPARASAVRSSPATARAENRAPATMSAKERASLNQSLARLEDALFDYDRSTIRQDATKALHEDVVVIRDILSAYPSQKLRIEGHADERGSDEYNLALGDRRARSAEEFLVTMGIPDRQLTLISFGKERPVCTDQTDDCWQRNRRAHLTAAP